MPVDRRQRQCYQEKAPELLAAIDPVASIMRREGAQHQCAQLCEGRCSIQARYGEQMLGDACYFYPRMLHAVADEYRMVGATSCPEMLRLILNEPDAFSIQSVAVPRLPVHRHNLVPHGWTVTQVDGLHRYCMEVAGDATRSPEASLAYLLHVAEGMTAIVTDDWRSIVLDAEMRMASTSPNTVPATPYALYYGLALLEAFGNPNSSLRLADIMATMEKQLDCRFDRPSRSITVGASAAQTYAQLVQRWQMDAKQSLASVLRRWLQAQLAMTYFPFGGFNDITMAQRAAILVQRFATVRLALMCHVSENGIPPDEDTILRVIQGISRFMDHIADAKLTLMIHRDSGWVGMPQLRGLIAAE